MEAKGYIHLYTGDGKGKTSAAIGLALRAAGAGKRVFIAQFVKGMHYSELESIRIIPLIDLKQYGLDCFIVKEPTEEDRQAAAAGLAEVRKIINDNEYDVLVLDEVCIALYYELFTVQEIIALLRAKPASMEIILTGRNAPAELYEHADLVTEMKEVKHYYQKGVMARKGIEF